MPTELEELVEFLHHGNTQIRQIACENLVGYSTAQPTLFKRNQLEPIKDLKLLIKDYPPIAHNALTILVNLTEDSETVEDLVGDDAFLESLLLRITSAKDPNADLETMILANCSKSENIVKLLTLKRAVPTPLSTSSIAIDQLLDCFVKGADRSYNTEADYDYLSYSFADISKHSSGRRHFLSTRAEDNDIIPLSKIVVFTQHKSDIRRRGVANTIKNVCFDTDAHDKLLTSEDEGGIGILPFILLPLMGSEEYDDEDTEGMLDECQLLPPDKERDSQNDIICTHVESLLLLSTTAGGRARLRAVKVYPIMRELHLHTKDEDVRNASDRLVNMLMRGEPGDPEEAPPKVEEVIEDEDEQIVDVV